MSEMHVGIDVSDNQGKIDHKKVVEAGCEFTILRSTRGSGKADYRFAENLAGFLALGILVEVYKYTYATTVAMAKAEAQKVLQLLQQYGHRCKIWWDVEDRNTVGLLSQSVLTACIRAAQETIEAAGYEFGIYTGENVIRENWFQHAEFNCEFWIARYPLDNGDTIKTLTTIPPADKMPRIGFTPAAWQWTSQGQVPGISGNVDLNVRYSMPAQSLVPNQDYMYIVSVADVVSREKAEEAACCLHKSIGYKIHGIITKGIKIWCVSIADVWTEMEAVAAQEFIKTLYPKMQVNIHKAQVFE